MENLPEALLFRLSEKTATPVERMRLVKDVTNILGDRGHPTMSLVNEKLVNLGWGREIIDSTSFELILSLHENDGMDEGIKSRDGISGYL